MLFPKFVPSCSQSWALFCIWNVRNALLHSLSHLDTLICKGCKERENTAGARMNLQHISFYCHCHLSHGCELGCGCCSAPRWLWAAACLPTAFQASRSCTKSPWRYSADTCLPQQCCPAGRGVTAPHSAALTCSAKAPHLHLCLPKDPHSPELCSGQMLSRKWKSVQGWILTVDVSEKLTLGVSLIFVGFLSGLPFRVRTHMQRAPWLPWVFSYCKFQTSPSTTVLLSV